MPRGPSVGGLQVGLHAAAVLHGLRPRAGGDRGAAQVGEASSQLLYKPQKPRRREREGLSDPSGWTPGLSTLTRVNINNNKKKTHIPNDNDLRPPPSFTECFASTFHTVLINSCHGYATPSNASMWSLQLTGVFAFFFIPINQYAELYLKTGLHEYIARRNHHLHFTRHVFSDERSRVSSASFVAASWQPNVNVTVSESLHLP